MIAVFRRQPACVATSFVLLCMLGSSSGCQSGLKIGQHWLIQPKSLADATSFELMQFQTAYRPTQRQIREITSANRLLVDLATGVARMTDGQDQQANKREDPGDPGDRGDRGKFRGGRVYETKMQAPQLSMLQKIVTDPQTLHGIKRIPYQYQTGLRDWYNLAVHNNQGQLTSVSWPASAKAPLPDAATQLISTFNRINRMAHRADQNVDLIR